MSDAIRGMTSTAPAATPAAKEPTVVAAGGQSLVDMAKRMGVTTEDLMRANPQIRDAESIPAGTEIHLPTTPPGSRASGSGDKDRFERAQQGRFENLMQAAVPSPGSLPKGTAVGGAGTGLDGDLSAGVLPAVLAGAGALGAGFEGIPGMESAQTGGSSGAPVSGLGGRPERGGSSGPSRSWSAEGGPGDQGLGLDKGLTGASGESTGVIRLPSESWGNGDNLSPDLQKQWNSGRQEAGQDFVNERIDQFLNAKEGTGILGGDDYQSGKADGDSLIDDALNNNPGKDAPMGEGDPDVNEALGGGSEPGEGGSTKETGSKDDSNEGSGTSGASGSNESTGSTGSTGGTDGTEGSDHDSEDTGSSSSAQESDPEDPPDGDSIDGDGQSGAPRGYFLPGGPGGPKGGVVPRPEGGDSDVMRENRPGAAQGGSGPGGDLGGSDATSDEKDTGHAPKIVDGGVSTLEPEEDRNIRRQWVTQNTTIESAQPKTAER